MFDNASFNNTEIQVNTTAKTTLVNSNWHQFWETRVY